MRRASMKRRTFVSLFGGAAAFPLAARAQELRIRPVRIGILRTSPTPQPYLNALRRGLADRGYGEGRDYVFVYRFGDGDSRKLPGLATALVGAGVHVIVTEGLAAAQAAHAASDTIPI